MTEITHFSSPDRALRGDGDTPEPARNGLNQPEQSGKVRQNRTTGEQVVPGMGTIIERHGKRGKKSYCAQIVVKEKGRTHRESKTFSSRPAARAWIDTREGTLSKPGALDRLDDPKFRHVIDRYLSELAAEPGKTKAQVLRTIKTYDIADMRCSKIKSQNYVDMIRSLPVKPQTRANYLSHISEVVSVAEAAWGYPLKVEAFTAAIIVCRKLKLTGKSQKRDRRPTLAELDMLMAHFAERGADGRSEVPMTKVIPFAIFSTRRLDEICRILRADYQPAHDDAPPRVLVRDLKNPEQKQGNNVWCDLTPEAAAFVEYMLASHSDERAFPYNSRTVGTYFADACLLLGINTPDTPEKERLRFHDLRHEGASWLFEKGGRGIPQVANITGHLDWKSLQRYSHIRQTGDKYANWKWKRP